MAIKVIHDTDIGSDLDDAEALAYLLAQPECELLGVTTVTGDVIKRAQMASALCLAAGKNVPIYPGASEPLLIRQLQPDVPQAIALDRWVHRTDFPTGQAVEFMRQTIRANPGEVVLLTTGPLTNVALLFRVDPEIPALLKGLVMMCGVIPGPALDAQIVEWNSLCDPHAAAIVYGAHVKRHRSIGLNVTVQVRLPRDEFYQRFAAPGLLPVRDFGDIFFQTATLSTFHDPLAAATIFDDALCTFAGGRIEIDLDSPDPKQRGRTIWTPDAVGGYHELANMVDTAGFFKHYFSMFE